MVHRNREPSAEARPPVAMIPMPMSSSTDNNNYGFDESSGKPHAAASSSNQPTNNYYGNFQQPSAPAGAYGGTEDGEIEYEPHTVYQSLEDDHGSNPEYEVVKPNRPLTRPKPPTSY